jgi:hypothetical protein
MPELQKIPTGKFHPGYGCAIFVLMILTFGGIVTWVVHTLLEQNRQITAFTVERADPMPPASASDADRSALREKLSAFGAAAENGDAAHLTLSVAECNVLLALATDAGIGGGNDSTPYSELLHFTGFDESKRLIHSDIRLPMNKLPWQEGRRFLVGQATFQTEIENGSLNLQIVGISVPGKTVPDGFVHNLKSWDWLDVAKKKDPRIATALKRTSNMHFSEDGRNLILECAKITPAPPAKS